MHDKKYNLYLGKAGHLAMMSEFLIRGWNVAIPEVDTGDDIFVVQDDKGDLKRVQVKTATAKNHNAGYFGKYLIPNRQLQRVGTPEVYYVFIVRLNDGWSKPLIVSQETLKEYVNEKGVGSVGPRNVMLHINFQNGRVECSKCDFSKHLDDFSDFPLSVS